MSLWPHLSQALGTLKSWASRLIPDMSDLPPEIDVSRPHPARMYDYYLGGKNHFAADREAADKWIAAVPSGPVGPRENRAFLGRAVKFLAAEAGIRQFLDIGTGLPTTGNVHDVAQAVNPACRVVYARSAMAPAATRQRALTSRARWNPAVSASGRPAFAAVCTPAYSNPIAFR